MDLTKDAISWFFSVPVAYAITLSDQYTVALWEMNGTAASTAKQSATVGSDLSEVSAPSSSVGNTGDSDGAYSFNGTSQYLTTPLAASNYGTEMTIEAWVKINSTGTEQSIYADWDWLPKKYVYFDISAAGYLTAARYGTASNTVTANGATQLQTGTWYHVAMTAKEGEPVRVYINGQLDGTSSNNLSGANYAGSSTYGAHSGMFDYHGTKYYYLDGEIDILHISNIKRSDQEITDWYNLTNGSNGGGSGTTTNIHSTTWSYTDYGLLDTLTTPDGKVTTYSYHVTGDTDTVTRDTQAVVSGTVLNHNDQITQRTMGNGLVESFTYDPAQEYRLTAKTTSDGTSNLQNLTYSFDGEGNILQIADTGTALPKTVDYSYDQLQRLVSATTTLASSTDVRAFSYSPTGNILTANGKSYVYGDSRHPQAATGFDGKSYSYDVNGNLSSKTISGSSNIVSKDNFTIGTMSDSWNAGTNGGDQGQTWVAGSSYDMTKIGINMTQGLPVNYVAGGTATLRIYDGVGTAGTVLYTQSFNTDAVGYSGNINTQPEYTFNLSSAVPITNGNAYTWTIKIDTGSTVDQLRIGTDNTITPVTNWSVYSGGTLYTDRWRAFTTYGDDGSGTSVTSYAYDWNDRLASVANGSTTIAEYMYNGERQRFAKTVGTSTKYYLNNFAEVDDAGAYKTFTFADTVRLATHDSDGDHYNIQNHLQSSSLTTDNSGAVEQAIDYFAFGSERVNSKSGNYDSSYTFTDQEKDSETGLMYYDARYYDPELRRFTSVDPWAGDNTNPQSLNKFSYTVNNPVKYVDPSGNFYVGVDAELSGNIAGFGIDVSGGFELDFQGISFYNQVNLGLTGNLANADFGVSPYMALFGDRRQGPGGFVLQSSICGQYGAGGCITRSSEVKSRTLISDGNEVDHDLIIKLGPKIGGGVQHSTIEYLPSVEFRNDVIEPFFDATLGSLFDRESDKNSNLNDE